MRFCKIGIISVAILLSMQKANGQTDFPMSVLTSSPAQLNPASTGLFNDVFRIHSYFKSQLAQSLTGGIKSTGIAVDYNFSEAKMGLGLAIFSKSVDRSALRDFNLLLSYGYRVDLNEWGLISLGVQGGFKQVGFSTERLYFGSQYDPSYKGGFDPNRLPPDLPYGNINSLDASVGVYWQNYLGTFFSLRTGFAAFHLIPKRTNFMIDEVYLLPKYVFTAQGRYEGDLLHWIPAAMLVSQSDRTYAEIGLTAQLRDAERFLNAGVFYRSPNVIIPTIGIGLDKLSLNLSLEYFFGTNFSKIFNIGISYFPQTNREVSVIRDFLDI